MCIGGELLLRYLLLKNSPSPHLPPGDDSKIHKQTSLAKQKYLRKGISNKDIGFKTAQKWSYLWGRQFSSRRMMNGIHGTYSTEPLQPAFQLGSVVVLFLFSFSRLSCNPLSPSHSSPSHLSLHLLTGETKFSQNSPFYILRPCVRGGIRDKIWRLQGSAKL